MLGGRNAQEVRRQNRTLILEILHSHSPISRSGMADVSGLTRATVTNIINEFIEVGLVEEVGKLDTPIGRKKRLLRLKKNAFYVIGADISRYKLRVGVFNTDAEPMRVLEEETPIDKGKDEVIRVLLEMIETAMKTSGVPTGKIYGIGVGIPGPLDYENGVVISPPRFENFANVPLRKILEEKFRMKVWIDNDANVAAMGEKWFGAGKKHENFLFVIADIGIGCGIVINKRLYRGSLNGAGEVGHIPVVLNADLQELESLASLSNVPSIFRARTELDVKLDDIIKLAGKGEKNSLKVFEEVGRYIAVAVATVVNILSPEMVIIGGRYVQVPGSLRIIKEVVEEFTFSQEKPKIVATELGEKAILLGAAALALEEIVSNPYELILKVD